MTERDVLITSCGPSLRPYWPSLRERYTLVLTEKLTAEGAKAQGWDAAWIGDYMPKVTDIALFNIVAQAMGEVNWPEAIAKFRWQAPSRDALGDAVWKTIHHWGQISVGATPETSVGVPWAIRYNMLQHIYGMLEEDDKGHWSCHAEDWLAGYVMHELVRIIPNIMSLDALRQQRKVVGMVLHEDMSNDCSHYAQWARANGVPSVQLAHGAYGAVKPGLTEGHEIHQQLVTDTMCVWNDGQKAFILRAGVEPDRVFVTGHGMTDLWATMIPDREHAKVMYGFDPARPVVMHVSSWVNRLNPNVFEDDLDRRFDTFLEACKLIPHFQVLIRPHPGTHKWTPDWHAQQMKRHGVSGAIASGELVPAVEAADVLFTAMTSTLDSEAAIINRPTVGFRKDKPASRKGFYVLVDDDPQAVADGIQLTLGREQTPVWQAARNKQLYDYFYIVDGHATERGLKVVYDTISQGSCKKGVISKYVPLAPPVEDKATCTVSDAIPITMECVKQKPDG